MEEEDKDGMIEEAEDIMVLLVVIVVEEATAETREEVTAETAAEATAETAGVATAAGEEEATVETAEEAMVETAAEAMVETAAEATVETAEEATAETAEEATAVEEEEVAVATTLVATIEVVVETAVVMEAEEVVGEEVVVGQAVAAAVGEDVDLTCPALHPYSRISFSQMSPKDSSSSSIPWIARTQGVTRLRAGIGADFYLAPAFGMGSSKICQRKKRLIGDDASFSVDPISSPRELSQASNLDRYPWNFPSMLKEIRFGS
jgi:hypothetical protein